MTDTPTLNPDGLRAALEATLESGSNLRRCAVATLGADPADGQAEEAFDMLSNALAEWHSQATRARQALSATPPTAGGREATHRHKKRGTEYVLLGVGKMQSTWWRKWIGDARDSFVTTDMSEVVVYRSVDDNSLWVRPREEFEDGRFEVLEGGKKW